MAPGDGDLERPEGGPKEGGGESAGKAPEESLSGLHPYVGTLPPLMREQYLRAQAMRERGVSLYPNTFRPGSTAGQVRAEFGEKTREELDEIKAERCLAGRVTARRLHGKTAFLGLLDSDGKIQLYARRDELSEADWALVGDLDLGDIIGAEGQVFKTRTGELTLHLKRAELVTKSLWPLPEKYHEMDPELKYRRRYVDLFMSEESRRVFLIRSRTVAWLRNFMASRGFVEAETPMLHPIPGGAKALPFSTWHNALKQNFYLRVAPELNLKRLLVGGLGRVFEINRSFRNEGLSVRHNPEFTMLEFYQSYATYEDLMALTEEMLGGLAQEVLGGPGVSYQGLELDFTPPFRRVSWRDALAEFGGAPEAAKADPAAAREFLKAADPEAGLPPDAPLWAVQEAIFDRTVEKNIVAPTFITGYPTELSPLARRSESDPSVTDRFELIVAGRELANAFSELNDPLDQYDRFEEQARSREAGDEEGMRLDRDYVRALMYGMPPAAGEGLGVDRLVMLLTDSASIRDVILFPQMRPEPF
jgi:lysyl-tRNA synthetase class 2